jgi:ribosomal protein S14
MNKCLIGLCNHCSDICSARSTGSCRLTLFLPTHYDQNEYEFKIYSISGVSNEKMAMSQIIKNKMEYPNRELKEHHSCQRCNEDDGTINDKFACSALRDRVSSRSGRIIIEIRRGTRGNWDKRDSRAIRCRSVE